MSELSDRRALKKAQTREHIRTTAQRLFAERGFDAVTIAEVAAGADVAVQTVFNHFATKEDLFFANRAPWVEGPADAVRNRPAGVRPEEALRDYLIDLVEGYMRRIGTPQHVALMRTLQASPALVAYERQLSAEAEVRLTAALVEAWSSPHADGDRSVPARPRLHAALIASVWLAGIRALLVEHRAMPAEWGDDAAVEFAVASARRILDHLSAALPLADGPQRRDRTGWPQVRRAG